LSASRAAPLFAARKTRIPLLVIASAPTRRGGYDSVQKLLQIENRPTAALCFNVYASRAELSPEIE
jgi:DNA-binding LacI/PurR family transcriptional regulator